MVVSLSAVLSIDIGGSKVMVGIVDSKGTIHSKAKESIKDTARADDLLDTICRLCQEAVRDYTGNDIICAGANIPGLADASRGLWVYSPFSGIRDFPLARELSKRLEMPVFLENDVNACAMAEIRFGACADVRNFIWVTISNGIGGSIVTDGKVYAGEYGNAGEIGHVCVDEDGYMCGCGNRGCAEASAAGPAILRRYIEYCGGTVDSAGLSAEIIANKARSGDETAIKVFEDTGYFLGKAVAAAVNLLNPQKVILGGGVSAGMDLFYPKMKKTLDSMVFRAANRDLSIERTALGYDAALFGAAATGFEGYT